MASEWIKILIVPNIHDINKQALFHTTRTILTKDSLFADVSLYLSGTVGDVPAYYDFQRSCILPIIVML